MGKKLYTYSELTDSAKKRAISSMRDKTDYIDSLIGYDWWAEEINCFIERIKPMGYSVVGSGVSFSGFWSQGDGASFTGEIDPVVFYKRKFLNSVGELDDVFNHASEYLTEETNSVIDYLKENCTINLVRSSHYYVHENTVTISMDFGDDESDYNSILTSIEDGALAEARGLMKELYRDLEKLYEDLSSEKAVDADLQEYDQLYYEDGTIASILESIED